MAIPREELQRHLDRSRAVQRRVVHVGVAIVAVALLLLVGGSGVWITQGHITDFQRQLREPGRRARR